MTTFDIEFATARTYVRIEPGCLASIGEALARYVKPTAVLVVSDETVAALYGEPVRASVAGAGFELDMLVLPPGDATKSLASAERIYDRLGDMRVARDGVVLALGGGMVSDLAGFAAATWMRGVRFGICPTTVEADVDASIGGKTAVNHRAGKNLVGAFHQPVLVHMDPLCLRTLDQRDVVAGLAESIKHAAIADEPFLTWHEANREAVLAREPRAMAELLERNVRIKAGVVVRDEREHTAVRASLNFGHTIGHAIEAACAYKWRHGECVALGMVAACRICASLGRVDGASSERLIRCIESYGLPVRLEAAMNADELLSYIRRDKKLAGGKVRFTLLDGLGRTVLRDDVSERTILDACRSLME